MLGRRVYLVAALLVAILIATPGPAQITPTYVPNQVILKFRAEATPSERTSIRADLTSVPLRNYGSIGAECLDMEEVTVEEAIARYGDHPHVEYIEPNYLWHADRTPNDPRFNELWGLLNTGQTGGVPGADIRAVNAWDLSTGDSTVLIGVIDTGVDYNHPDLAANIWTNPGEIPGNFIDDDANGYVDDVHGYDFVNNDGDPWDDAGHGTHVSGTIAAVGDNNIGVVGVNWRAKIVGIKFLNSGGSGTTADAIAAVEYANAIGLKITNNSWGGGSFSQPLKDAIEAGGPAGHLFIAASGNSSLNTDLIAHYPSSYDSPNILSVAATDHLDDLGWFSNYGPTSVDLAAPGQDILSLTPGGGYRLAFGTSMATPHVAGVAGLVLARFPAMGTAEIKDLILRSVDPLPSLAGRVLTGGRLNAFMTISDPDSIAPAAVTDLAIEEINSNSIRIMWTATGDDSTTGKASSYEIRYATFPIDAVNFPTANQVPAPYPEPAGTSESMEIGGLDFSTPYYIALKARDEFGNAGGLSNVVSATTLGIPAIAVSPDSLYADLLTGAADTQTLTLTNTGQGTLDFEVASMFTAAGSGFQHEYLHLERGQEDPRVGEPVTTGFGGPDGGGYEWIDSNEPHGPDFDWVDITSVGTPLPIIGDDQSSAPVPLGFDFTYYDNTFNTVRVCTNGFLSFTDASVAFGNQPLPNPGAPANMLAPMWDDLSFSGVQKAYSYTDGSRFIVSWIDVPHLGSGGSHTFQVILYPSGEIRYQYLRLDGSTTSATVGMQNQTRDIGLNIAFNTAYLQDSLAVKIAKTPEWLTVSPSSGRVRAGESIDLQVSFDALGLFGGDYQTEISLSSNDPVLPQLEVPVQMHVTGAPDVALSETSLDFGTVFLLGTETRMLRVENLGTDVLSVTSVGTNHADFIVSGAGFDLGVGEHHELQVGFAPTSSGLLTGVLSLDSNDPDEPTVMVTLSGTGTEPPEIAVSPDSLSDHLLTGGTSVHEFTIENTGIADLEYFIAIRPLADSGAAAPVVMTTGGGLGVALAHPLATPIGAGEIAGFVTRYEAYRVDPPAGGTAEIANPQSDGRERALYEMAQANLADSYVIFHDDMESGVNGWSHYATHSNGIDQWQQTTNRSSSAITSWRVTQHSGFGSDALESPPIDLSNFSAAALSFEHWYNFDDCSDPLFESDGGIVEVSVNDGASWTQIFPLGGYPYVLDDICDNPLAFYEAYGHDGGDGPLFVPAVFDLSPYAGGEIRIRFHAGWDCGNCNTNEGWYIDDVTVYSDTPPWLALSNSEGLVPSGGRDTIAVTFDAQGLFGGVYEADIAVISNDPDDPEVTVAAYLEVTGAPDIAVSPSSFDYGPVFIGLAVPDTLTIANVGTDLLTVSGLSVDDADYQLDGSGFALAPTESREITVTFVPSRAGPIPGELTINSDDPDTSALLIPLSATGVDPPVIVVSPDSLSEHLFSGESTTQTLTVENDGDADLEWTVELGSFSSSQLYTLTIPDPAATPLSGEEGPSSIPPIRQEAIAATLADLTGKQIMWDRSHGQSSIYSYSSLLANDLILRGATVTENLQPITGAVLNQYDVMWTRETFVIWSPAEIAAIQTWVQSGGALLLEGDQDDVLFNDILSGMGAGIEYSSSDGVGGTTTSIYPHETTDGVSSIYIGGPIGHLSSVVLPAGRLVDDLGGFGNSAYSTPGSGRVVALADEMFADFVIGVADNQLFANQVVDWLAGAVWLAVDPTAGTVPSGATDTLSVLLDATGLFGGDYDALITVGSNDPLKPETEVPVHLDVTGAPNIVLSDSTFDYGTLFLGLALAETLTISNLGTDLLTVSGLSVDESDYQVDGSGFALAIGESRDVTVTFVPSRADSIPGTLTVLSDDPGTPTLGVPLFGIGVEPPEIVVSPDSLSDHLLTGATSVHEFTIDNTGVADLEYVLAIGEPADSGAAAPVLASIGGVLYGATVSGVLFTIDLATGAGTLVGPLPDGTTEIEYDPGSGRAFLQSPDGAFRGQEFDILTGLAIGSSISNGYAFNGLEWIGADLYGTAITGPGGPSDLRILDPWTGASVPVGSTGMGPISGLAYDKARGILYGIEGGGQASSDLLTIDIQTGAATVIGPSGFRAGSLEFGPDGALYGGGGGSDAGNIYRIDTATGAGTLLGNSGFGTVSGLALKAAPFTWLSLSPTEGVVPSGESDTVAVTFDAQGLFGGVYEADIVVISNDPDDPEVTVAAYLEVTGAPDIAVSPSSFDYGTVFIGLAVPDTLTIANVGTDLLTVSGLSVDDADYQLDGSGFSLVPNESREITVSFVPSRTGPIPGELTINSDDPDTLALLIPLSGTGVQPPVIVVSPDSLSEHLFSGETSTQTLTVENDGDADLEWTATLGDFSSSQGKQVYTLTLPDPEATPLSGEEGPSSIPPIRQETIAATLEDLTGKRIMWDRSHGQGSILSNWNTIAVDLVLRGAVVTENLDSLCSAVLNQYDVMWTLESSAIWSPAEIAAIQTWVQSGGALLLEGDQSEMLFNDILSGMGAGIEYSGSSGFGGTTTNIYPHETTEGVSSINVGNPLAHLSTVVPPAGRLVDDQGGLGNTAYSTPGSGRVVAMADEMFADFVIGSADNQLFANQVIDWLVGAAWLSVEPTAGTIPSSSSQELTVTFESEGLFGGSYDAVIEVASNDPLRPEIAVPAHLDVTGAPNIVVSDTTLDYGQVFIGGTLSQILTVSNNGTDVLTVSGVVVDEPDFNVDGSGFALAIGESHDLEVFFTPTQAAFISGTLTIFSDDPNRDELPVTLFGEGIIPPEIAVHPTSVASTIPIPLTETQSLTLRNEGGSDLIWSLTLHQRSQGSESGQNLYTLPAFDISAAPPSGERQMEILPTPQQEPLTGEFEDLVGVKILWDRSHGQGSYVFSHSDIVADLVVRGATVTENQLPITLELLSDYDIMWLVDGPPVLWTPEQELAVATWVSSGGGLFIEGDETSYFNDLLSFMGAGITYTFGSGTGGVTNHIFPHATTNGLSSVYIGGVLSELAVTSPAAVLVEDASNDPNTAYSLVGGGRVLAMADELIQDFTISLEDNRLFANQIFDWLSGAPRWLTAVPETGVVAAGDSTEITLSLVTEHLLPGIYNADLSFQSNDPTDSILTVPVSLEAVGVPIIAVNPTHLDYDTVFVGVAKDLPLVVSNPGLEELNVSSAVFTNSKYSLAGGGVPVTVGIGDSVELTIRFAPTAHCDPCGGALSLFSDAPFTPELIVPLAGIGHLPPVANTDPDSLKSALATTLGPSAMTETKSILLSNTGASNLVWSAFTLDETPDGTTVPAMGGRQVLPAVSQLGTQGEGGPDASGYRWHDSDDPNGPVFDWVDITSVGTEISIPRADMLVGPFPLPFTFPFYDGAFNQFKVSSNGFVTFNGVSARNSNTPLPSSGHGVPINLLAAFWDDLDFPSGGSVFYHYDGTRFIISFHDVARVVTGGPYTFQIILDPSGTILYQYLDMGPLRNSATVGIQNATRDVGLQVAYDEDYVRNGLAVRISNVPPWMSLASSRGVILPGEQFELDVLFNAQELEDGDYVGTVRIVTNDPAHLEIVIPSDLHVGVMTADFDFDPNTVNRTSQGRWVHSTVELPAGYSPRDILESSFRLQRLIPIAPNSPVSYSDEDQDQLEEGNYKFDRESIQAAIPEGEEVPVEIIGQVEDVSWFAGLDLVRVLPPHVNDPPPAGDDSTQAMYSADSQILLEWEDPEGFQATDYDLWYSWNAGEQWEPLELGYDQRSYLWTVPQMATTDGMLEIVSRDELGIMGSWLSRRFIITTSVTDVAAGLPVNYGLRLLGSTPIRDRTQFELALPERVEVDVKLYDLRGAAVRNLHRGAMEPGFHVIPWDGRDDAGRRLASGVYFARTIAGTQTLKLKLVLIR